MIWAVLVLIVYSLFLIVVNYQWKQIPLIEESQEQPYVTVVVPVRNESQNIVETLTYIASNHYNNFEVIVINDHSTDDTLEKTEDLHLDKVQIIDLEGEFGKKAAISKAVELSKGELIICTDGDTYVGHHWIQSHVNAYNKGAKLAFGQVKYRKSSFSNAFNQELAALVALGAVSVQMGKPGMINGCNYSFSKEVFKNLDGFRGNDDIPSGDDEFLLRKIHHSYKNSVSFLKDGKALVLTEMPKSWKEFYHQRRRWASKWKKHSDIFSKISAISVFGLHLMLLYMMSVGMVYHTYWVIFALLFRAVSEYLLIRTVNGPRTSIPIFLFLQIIYPIYAVFFGIASTFGKYRWRGRTYQI